MSRTTARTIGGQFTAAVVAVFATALVLGGGFAFAQEAPEAGTGVAEALAGPNTVNSAAIINGTVGRADMKPGALPLWAHVDAGTATVTKLAGKGVPSVTRQNLGVYRVVFSQSVLNCGIVATRSDNDDGISSAGEISVEFENVNTLPNNVWVRTYNSAGVLADTNEDEGFTVTAFC